MEESAIQTHRQRLFSTELLLQPLFKGSIWNSFSTGDKRSVLHFTVCCLIIVWGFFSWSRKFIAIHSPTRKTLFHWAALIILQQMKRRPNLLYILLVSLPRPGFPNGYKMFSTVHASGTSVGLNSELATSQNLLLLRVSDLIPQPHNHSFAGDQIGNLPKTRIFSSNSVYSIVLFSPSSRPTLTQDINLSD